MYLIKIILISCEIKIINQKFTQKTIFSSIPCCRDCLCEYCFVCLYPHFLVLKGVWIWLIEQIGKFIYIDDQASKYTEHEGATENEVSFMFFSKFSQLCF